MKKLLILLMALGLFVASCNNDKTGKNQNSNNRQEDDYGKSETLNKNDEKKSEEKIENKLDDNNTNSMASGWPLVEKISFKTNCEKKAMATGASLLVAQNYCDCMLTNMENLYPDIKDAAGLTEKDLETPAMKQMIKDCLGKN